MFDRVKMMIKPELEARRKFVVPMDILLKTPEEYERTQATFNAKIII
jgi:hypothetical protein